MNDIPDLEVSPPSFSLLTRPPSSFSLFTSLDFLCTRKFTLCRQNAFFAIFLLFAQTPSFFAQTPSFRVLLRPAFYVRKVSSNSKDLGQLKCTGRDRRLSHKHAGTRNNRCYTTCYVLMEDDWL